MVERSSSVDSQEKATSEHSSSSRNDERASSKELKEPKDKQKEPQKAQPAKKEERKKKSFSAEDPSIADLFKPEVMVPKKVPIKRVNSIENTSTCIAAGCEQQARRLNDKDSIYCSKECIESYVNKQIKGVRKIRAENALKAGERKSISEDDRKVPLVDRKSGIVLTGSNSVEEAKALAYVLEHPTYEIHMPVRKPSTNVDNATPSGKKNSTNSKEQPAAAEADARKAKLSESSQDPRKMVAIQLRDALNNRVESCGDLKIEADNVRRIANRIERQLFELFKEANKSYKTRFRSLLFNLKDPKNGGLFRKVLSGGLEPYDLVRMSSEEMASPELAKWRERENRHSIEMIKKDAVAQANQIVVKKTHKGEEVIKQSAAPASVFEEIKKTESAGKEAKGTKSSGSAAKVVSAKEMLSKNPLDVLLKDTSDQHGQPGHLFDFHCKICSNQAKADMSLTNRPKPLSQFEKNRLREAELEKRAAAELNNIDKLLQADTSASADSFAPQDDPAIPPPPRTIHSCWNGYLCYKSDPSKEMPRFIAFAYKISGLFESQVGVWLPR